MRPKIRLDHLLLAMSAALGSGACGGARAKLASTPPEPPPAILYHDSFPYGCPPVDPNDVYWQGFYARSQEHTGSQDVSFDFNYVRATLFGIWAGNGTGCLRVDVMSPPGDPAVDSLDVHWEDPWLIRLGEDRSYDFGKAPHNVIYSVGIPVKCTAGCNESCLRPDVTVVSSDPRKVSDIGNMSMVRIRSGLAAQSPAHIR
jgi:hypothetical protein